MALSVKPIYGKKLVIIDLYRAGDHGYLRPDTPEKCPLSKEHAGPCQIHVERWRQRKHGPGYYLLTFVCLNGKGSFTVYPPGWLPYGRKPIYSLDHLGQFVVKESLLSDASRPNAVPFGAPFCF